MKEENNGAKTRVTAYTKLKDAHAKYNKTLSETIGELTNKVMSLASSCSDAQAAKECISTAMLAQTVVAKVELLLELETGKEA